MMNNLNDKVISAIQQHLPKGTKITNILIEILNISRESVYRRLRSEINFTFAEITLIATKLGFSIDSITEIEKTENFIFKMHIEDPDPFETYFKKLNDLYQTFLQLNSSKNGKVKMAFNRIPHYFIIFHKTLSKFTLYKWYYQTQKTFPNFSLSDFKIPQKILTLQEKFSYEIFQMPDSTIILDQNNYLAIIKDIDYFYKRNLISETELEHLKEELLTSVDLTEKYASHGVSESGAEIMMYISSVDIESSYVYMEYDNHQYAHVNIFTISSIDTQIPEVCLIYEKWINSLKKYSTLVSQSGELHRFEYFSQQRKYINELLEKKTN